VKWNIARGFRYQVTKTTEDQWLLERKSGGSDWEASKFVVERRLENGKITGKCECNEAEHTGFPCGHVCLLNYKGLIEEMSIHQRWWRVTGKTQEGIKQVEEDESECIKPSTKK
jgi:hypothetical protein